MSIMTHEYDAQYVEGMFYVVETPNNPGRNSRATLEYHEALQFQRNMAKHGITAIIRTW